MLSFPMQANLGEFLEASALKCKVVFSSRHMPALRQGLRLDGLKQTQVILKAQRLVLLGVLFICFCIFKFLVSIILLFFLSLSLCFFFFFTFLIRLVYKQVTV